MRPQVIGFEYDDSSGLEGGQWYAIFKGENVRYPVQGCSGESPEEGQAYWRAISEAIWDILVQAMGRFGYGPRPRVFQDGNQWCCLFGENLQEGIAGFGDTPEQAYEAFMKDWRREIADGEVR